MAVNTIIIGSTRQTRLKAGVDDNNFVRVQDLNAVIEEINTEIESIESTISVAEVELSSAQITSMNSTPVEVIPAQGVGTVIEVVSYVLILDYGTATYTGGGNIILDNEGVTVSTSTGAGAITSGSDLVTIVPPISTSYVAEENTVVSITNDTAPFATGDGVVRLKISYRVHNTGL